MGSPTGQHLTVQARQNGGKRIEVQYHDTLQSLNNPENSLINLGYVHDGVVQFVLASNDGVSYVSSNPPVAWMQSTLSTIGSKTMRTLSMPASHDSGISELTYKWNGIPHNTQTQSVHVYKQLLNGARFFDIRPVLYKGKWYTGHFSPFMGKDWVGATGRTIDHIISDINRFTAEHPGELIVLDITHDASIDRWWTHLSADEWQNLYVKLSAIKDLWIPENGDNLPYDISTAPISTYIKPGSRSAVIIRIPGSAPEPGINLHKRTPPIPGRNRPADGIRVEPSVYETFNHDEIPVLDTENGFGDSNITLAQPVVFLNTMFAADSSTAFGPWKQAFFSSNRLPQSGSYAETRWPTQMSSNQLEKLSRHASEGDAPHMSYWILTQYWTDITDFGTPRHSIIHMARKAYRALFTDLWPSMRRGNKWPNLIIMDDIHNTEVAALCMGINSYFHHPDTGNRFQKRGTISTGRNNSTKTGEHTRCEADTRIRNENERRHLFTEQQKSFKRFQDFQQKQTWDQENSLETDRLEDKERYDRKMEDLHEQQTSETISVYHNLNNDRGISPAEKRKIKERLADSQSQERLELSNMHWKIVHEMKVRAEKMKRELIEEQSVASKAFLARQEKEMNELKMEQNDFLDNVLKHFFRDDKTPFCPKSRHEWPIPKGMPTSAKPHKNIPAYNSTSSVYVTPAKAHYSVEKNPYVVHPTGAYYSTSKNPYLVRPTGEYYTTSKKHYAVQTEAYYSVSSKIPYVVRPTGAYHAVSNNPHVVPNKVYHPTSKAPYRVAPTGGYYPVSENPYHPVPTGAYYSPSKNSYVVPSKAYHSTPKAPYHVALTPVSKNPYRPVLTGAYYSPLKKVYPTGVYHSSSKSPYSVVATGAYHQSRPAPVNAYSVSSTQGGQPAPTSTFVRPYHRLPSGLRVHSAPYGKPKPVYAQPTWSNGTYTTTKAAYGTNIPLPPYNTGPGLNQNPYSISRPLTNITTSEAPQTPKTTTANGGTTTFTEFSTFAAFRTIPASRRLSPVLSSSPAPSSSLAPNPNPYSISRPSTNITTSEAPQTPKTTTINGGTTTLTEFSTFTAFRTIPASRRPSPAPSSSLAPSSSPVYVPTTSEEPLEPITKTITGGTTTFTVFSTHTVFGVLPATPVHNPGKSVPAVSTPLPKMPVPSPPVPTTPVLATPATPVSTTPAPTSPVQTIPEQSTPVPSTAQPSPMPIPSSYVTANAARTQVWGILGLVSTWALAFFWGMV